MGKLFAEIKVEDYFEEITTLISEKINSYPENYLLSTGIETIADQLIQLPSIQVPSLIKERTNSYITTSSLAGSQLPSELEVIPDEKYSVDMANYRIPFTGSPEIFKWIPATDSNATIEASIENGEILIQLTMWGKMIGNERIQNHIRDKYQKCVEQIEYILSKLQTDVDQFLELLKPFIYKELNEKVSEIKLKNRSLK
jgi:hypothetical protein